MSRTSTSPERTAPSPTAWPILGRVKVTVRSARTARPSTSPVSAATPLAMSAATTAARLSFIQSTAAAKGEPAAMGRERPTPKTASITTSHPSTQARWLASAGSNCSSSTPHSLRRRVSSRASRVSFS